MCTRQWFRPAGFFVKSLILLVPRKGFEPPTHALRKSGQGAHFVKNQARWLKAFGVTASCAPTPGPSARAHGYAPVYRHRSFVFGEAGIFDGKILLVLQIDWLSLMLFECAPSGLGDCRRNRYSQRPTRAT